MQFSQVYSVNIKCKRFGTKFAHNPVTTAHLKHLRKQEPCACEAFKFCYLSDYRSETVFVPAARACAY